MTKKLNCKGCGKPIIGRLRIHTYRKQSGNKSILVVDVYDENCFKAMNKRTKNGSLAQKRDCKKTNKKKA